MGTVTNVIIDQTTGKMSVILVAFDSEHVGQEVRYTSVYNSINQNAVPIQTQATFHVDQFPLDHTHSLNISRLINPSQSLIPLEVFFSEFIALHPRCIHRHAISPTDIYI